MSTAVLGDPAHHIVDEVGDDVTSGDDPVAEEEPDR